MKVSIVTVAYNAQATIAETLASVRNQTHSDVEHIVVDGASTDGTLAVVKAQKISLGAIISEPDSGIYDAMNKGIAAAKGDVIGLLNADDVYAHNDVLSQVVTIHRDKAVDACYANLDFVSSHNSEKVRRVWRSRPFKPGLCFSGWMPAHPTLFLSRAAYQQVGLYDTRLKYQSDLEFCARAFEVHKIRSHFVPEVWIHMRLGGVSNNSFRTMWQGNWESYFALRRLGLKTNPVTYFFRKFVRKLPQFYTRGGIV